MGVPYFDYRRISPQNPFLTIKAPILSCNCPLTDLIVLRALSLNLRLKTLNPKPYTQCPEPEVEIPRSLIQLLSASPQPNGLHWFFGVYWIIAPMAAHDYPLTLNLPFRA